jgi:hypothetical protein
MPLPFTVRRTDPDAAAFCARSGATDRAAINAFVRGVKDLGLWENMVCWPLRSSQNAGTGTTAYSLGGLGTFNGTLTNGPTWGTDGVTMLGANSQSIDIADNALLRRSNSVGLIVVASTSTTANFDTFIPFLGKSAGGGAQLHNYQIEEQSGSRVVNFVTGDGVAFGIGVGASIGADTNKHCMIGSALAGGTNKFKIDAAAIVSANNTLAQLNGASTAPLRFNRSNGFARGGEYSFGGMFATDLSDANISGLYNLYRQTLGTGLGLP